jgi:hypothetical protein
VASPIPLLAPVIRMTFDIAFSMRGA